MAKPTRKTEFAGVGCLIQGCALLAPVLGGALLGSLGVTIGIVAAIPLFLIGSSKSAVWTCSECRNPVAGKQVKVCPACQVSFE